MFSDLNGKVEFMPEARVMCEFGVEDVNDIWESCVICVANECGKYVFLSINVCINIYLNKWGYVCKKLYKLCAGAKEYV